MFYENERIVRKQVRVVNSRAYDIIQDLESKGLGDKEIVACIGLLLKQENSEFQVDILNFALKTVNTRQESVDAAKTIDTSYSFIDGRVQCKSVNPERPNLPKKRKV
jgi:dTDP-glucose pyrophosphorylase